VTGEPVGDAETGETVGDAVTGEPVGSAVTGESVGDAVTGETVGGAVTGEPVGDAVTGEPVGDAVTGDPVGDAETGETVGDLVTGEPVGGAVTGEPVGDAVTGTAVGDLVTGEPVGNAVSGTLQLSVSFPVVYTNTRADPGVPVSNEQTLTIREPALDQPPWVYTSPSERAALHELVSLSSLLCSTITTSSPFSGTWLFAPIMRLYTMYKSVSPGLSILITTS
jgi:hypothetical protein